MSDYILFFNSKSDISIAKEIYESNSLVRIKLYEAISLSSTMKSKGFDKKLWIDPSYDGFPEKKTDSSWAKYLSCIPGYEKLSDDNFLRQPKKDPITENLFSVLDSCLDLDPDAISIPQLPYLDSIKNNKINTLLAKVFKSWRIDRGYEGSVILPVIFLNKKATSNGTERTKRLKQIEKNYRSSMADSIWIVDSSLQDQAGTSNFDKERFPNLIDIHTRVKDTLNPKMHIAGPYWGLNIMLWARNTITSPAFAIGSGYQYYTPGGQINNPVPRMAISPLRRWARANSQLEGWLKRSAMKLRELPEGKFFNKLLQECNRLKINKNHKRQIAQEHYSWFKEIECISKEGRALALYQDLSKAYVLGTQLDDIPSENGTSKKPEIIAKQLMLNCL